ncbi:hypothetical protein TNCV_3663641 [Trichonephila clavipes]|nr:hypothetical protein TNCV_3663641 [Trichonephila clavipes]
MIEYAKCNLLVTNDKPEFQRIATENPKECQDGIRQKATAERENKEIIRLALPALEASLSTIQSINRKPVTAIMFDRRLSKRGVEIT